MVSGGERKELKTSLCCLHSKNLLSQQYNLMLVKQAIALSWLLLWETDGNVLIGPNWLRPFFLLFFDHLGWKCWNMSVFAHKWKTERPPVRLSQASLKLSHSEKMIFFLELMHTQCLGLFASILKISHTVTYLPEHILHFVTETKNPE